MQHNSWDPGPSGALDTTDTGKRDPVSSRHWHNIPAPGAQLRQTQPCNQMGFPSNKQREAGAAHQESGLPPHDSKSLNEMGSPYTMLSPALQVSKGQRGLPWLPAPLLACSGLAWGNQGAEHQGLAPLGIATRLPIIFGGGISTCHHGGTQMHMEPPPPRCVPLSLG